ILFERRCRKGQHVRAGLIRSLIEWAGRHRQAAAESTTNGGNRVLGIVFELIRWSLARRSQSQLTVACRAVRTTVRVQVVFGVASPRQREFLLVAPHVLTHDKEADGSRIRKIVLPSLQRVVKPLKGRIGLI